MKSRGHNRTRQIVLAGLLVFSLRVDATVSVASINLCTDQLVLLLADSEQILSLSNLSHQSNGSYYYEKARQYPINKGHAEQILPLKPDIVLAGPFTQRNTLRQLKELGLMVHILPIARSVEMMINNVKTVAGLLKQPRRGARIIKDIRDRLSDLDEVSAERPLAAVYDPNGYTVGVDTLRGEIIELAGWANVASIMGITSYGSLSLEVLVRQAPDALIDSPYSEGTYSRAQALTQHPSIRKAGLDPMVIHVPSRDTICAGPWTVDVIEQLQMSRKQLVDAKP